MTISPPKWWRIRLKGSTSKGEEVLRILKQSARVKGKPTINLGKMLLRAFQKGAGKEPGKTPAAQLGLSVNRGELAA